MTKDDTKLFNDLKDKMKQEFRRSKEYLERDFHNDITQVHADLPQIKTSMDFMNSAFEDMKGRTDTAMNDNATLRRETQSLCEKSVKDDKRKKSVDDRV